MIEPPRGGSHSAADVEAIAHHAPELLSALEPFSSLS
jgi:hypothetical protein